MAFILVVVALATKARLSDNIQSSLHELASEIADLNKNSADFQREDEAAPCSQSWAACAATGPPGAGECEPTTSFPEGKPEPADLIDPGYTSSFKYHDGVPVPSPAPFLTCSSFCQGFNTSLDGHMPKDAPCLKDCTTEECFCCVRLATKNTPPPPPKAEAGGSDGEEVDTDPEKVLAIADGERDFY